MQYELLKEVIAQLEVFDREDHGSNLRDFTMWLYNQLKVEEDKIESTPNLDGNLDPQISQLINIFNAHSKHYTKTALKNSPLVSVTDFGFLMSLMEEGSIRKTDLIARNYSELSPGIEVIKRLLRQELVEDFNDPLDGRSKRVRITPKGAEVFQSVLSEINRAARLMSGNLEVEEKLQLLALGNKLKSFHQIIWDQARGQDLTELENRFLPDYERVQD